MTIWEGQSVVAPAVAEKNVVVGGGLLRIHNKENQNKQINTYLFRCAVYGSRCMMVSTG